MLNAQPTAAVAPIMATIASGNILVRSAQQRRILKAPYWRPVLAAILGGKAYTGPTLVADVPSADVLVTISQLGAADAKNLCSVIFGNRAYRDVYVALFGGRTTLESIPDNTNPEQ